MSELHIVEYGEGWAVMGPHSLKPLAEFSTLEAAARFVQWYEEQREIEAADTDTRFGGE